MEHATDCPLSANEQSKKSIPVLFSFFPLFLSWRRSSHSSLTTQVYQICKFARGRLMPQDIRPPPMRCCPSRGPSLRLPKLASLAFPAAAAPASVGLSPCCCRLALVLSLTRAAPGVFLGRPDAAELGRGRRGRLRWRGGHFRGWARWRHLYRRRG